MARCFYSIVQYCPDRFRAEAANLGLVLLCLDPHQMRVRMTDKFDRLRKFFAITQDELKNLKVAVHGLASRIEKSDAELNSFEALSAFAATRANDLRLTEPRLAKVDDFDADFERLFTSLVFQQSTEDRADASPAKVLPPRLGEVFYRLSSSHKIWSPGKIAVPVYKRKLEVPYAYRNGVVNLVKPHVFPANKHAETQAATLAVNGDLIKRHPIDGENRCLIVVSTQETAEQAKEINDHVQPLFKEYGVRLIRPHDIDAFAEEVERSAH